MHFAYFKQTIEKRGGSTTGVVLYKTQITSKLVFNYAFKLVLLTVANLEV